MGRGRPPPGRVRPLKRSADLAWLCAAALAVLPATGWAQSANSMQTALGTATRLTGGIGGARYVSEERLSSGSLFNREEGDLLRAELELRHSVGPWAWQVARGRSHGTLDYRGRTQLGLPLRTFTDLQRDELALALEHRWAWSDLGVTWGAGMDTLRTRRHIRRTAISGALTETLRSELVFVRVGGYTATSLAARPLRLGGSLQVGYPWSQSLSVDTHGVTDPFVLRPASRWSGRLRVEALWSVTGDFAIAGHLGQETYRPGASAAATVYRNGVAVGGASYPGSVQKFRFGVISGVWQF
jgi:hypothetical protein